ncbi:GAF domain-containing protein [Limnothrix sp. FACHB-708]|uniref:GAF domain-containing sensor histidine kinase n=1 Tax=unclassified Limnothrix TaxID=2632864 RepID=UPI001685FE91|nr:MULTISPECIES: ATP-binding protein [unclassified Limnothrix]MBD2554762.1 GAF domain-containing protein [Limnothrix sp. FACHB-708]MBD2591969.1 GAF domain-containing protein [Limnothrix sp. FACHB-406]
MDLQKIKEIFEAIVLGSQSYMPHGHCYLWQTPLVGLHVVSDSLIAIAYFSIPAMLMYFAYQRRKFLPISIFLMFGAFIILCGLGHLLEVWTLWYGAYWLAGIEKALTALISCYTAVSLVNLLPQFLSLRSPDELERINQQLQQEVSSRELIAQELAQINQNLEARIADRTVELQTKNTQLMREIQERQSIEQSLARRLACEQIFSKTLQRVWTTADFEPLFQTLVQDVREFLQVDRVLIFQLNGDFSGAISTESVSDPSLSLLGQSFTDPCFQEKHAPLYQAGRICMIEDIEASPLQECHREFLRSLRVRSNLVIPILWKSESSDLDWQENLDDQAITPAHFYLWGLLIAQSCQGARSWDNLEVEALQQLSLQLGIALRQSKLMNRLQEELQEKQQTALALQASEQEARQQAASLATTLNQLQATQAQLVQSEKLASLGKMVGGIAHEINNPLSFIYGNLTHAQEYSHQVFQGLDLYQQHYPNPVDPIAQWLSEVEFEFLKTDFPNLLTSMKNGADRIREIVLLLRNFSRLDESELKSVDIHDGINSTLSILTERFLESTCGQVIQSHCAYDRDIPTVECYPGLLNQALFNLFSNALDAIEERCRLQEMFVPMVKVETRLICQQHANGLTLQRFAQIQITDNGSGIDPALADKIFDPFFTTKPIGQGTGMGLANAYQIIVKRHHGELWYQVNEQGQTQFVVKIPIEQYFSSPAATERSVSPAMTIDSLSNFAPRI